MALSVTTLFLLVLCVVGCVKSKTVSYENSDHVMNPVTPTSTATATYETVKVSHNSTGEASSFTASNFTFGGVPRYKNFTDDGNVSEEEKIAGSLFSRGNETEKLDELHSKNEVTSIHINSTDTNIFSTPYFEHKPSNSHNHTSATTIKLTPNSYSENKTVFPTRNIDFSERNDESTDVDNTSSVAPKQESVHPSETFQLKKYSNATEIHGNQEYKTQITELNKYKVNIAHETKVLQDVLILKTNMATEYSLMPTDKHNPQEESANRSTSDYSILRNNSTSRYIHNANYNSTNYEYITPLDDYTNLTISYSTQNPIVTTMNLSSFGLPWHEVPHRNFSDPDKTENIHYLFNSTPKEEIFPKSNVSEIVAYNSTPVQNVHKVSLPSSKAKSAFFISISIFTCFVIATTFFCVIYFKNKKMNCKYEELVEFIPKEGSVQIFENEAFEL